MPKFFYCLPILTTKYAMPEYKRVTHLLCSSLNSLKITCASPSLNQLLTSSTGSCSISLTTMSYHQSKSSNFSAILANEIWSFPLGNTPQSVLLVLTWTRRPVSLSMEKISKHFQREQSDHNHMPGFLPAMILRLLSILEWLELSAAICELGW